MPPPEAAPTTRFPGQYFDKKTGLDYNGMRDYDPATGRYAQSDPIGFAGGVNTYGYVGANPVSVVDPFGTFCWPAFERRCDQNLQSAAEASQELGNLMVVLGKHISHIR